MLEAGRPALRSFRPAAGSPRVQSGSKADTPRLTYHEESYDPFLQCQGLGIPYSQSAIEAPARQLTSGP